jgi:NAD(P)-dependent dehydrogenase (short-subunit alcohol dehydrogenase family)
MKTDFENRFAVVTGASSGIGFSVAKKLLDGGANVLAMSRHQGELSQLEEKCPTKFIWIKGDVTNQADLDRLAKAAKTIAPIDFLVPNAGIAQLADGLDLAAFEKQWAVNGSGALNTLKSLRRLLAGPSSVVFISTFLSEIAFPGLAAYIASKAALKAMVKTLAIELAADQIRVNLVAPGPTATPIWGTLGLSLDKLASVASAVNQRLVGEAFLDADAVADVICFMLTKGAKGVYGQEWVVDNGYTLR